MCGRAHRGSVSRERRLTRDTHHHPLRRTNDVTSARTRRPKRNVRHVKRRCRPGELPPVFRMRAMASSSLCLRPPTKPVRISLRQAQETSRCLFFSVTPLLCVFYRQHVVHMAAYHVGEVGSAEMDPKPQA